MRILLAPDKFKGTLSAIAVCEALADGLGHGVPDAEVISFPLADGGEGTLDVLSRALALQQVAVDVSDPLHRRRTAVYGLNKKTGVAVIEMAQASGLELLASEERHPAATTTLGTGELIRDAIHKGAKEIFLTVGGSATNDAGAGMACALGYRFYNKAGKPFVPVGGTLIDVQAVDASEVQDFRGASFTVLVDVDNPLTGPSGAARVYAGQKGATPSEIERLDEGLISFSAVLAREWGKHVENLEGAGAGGGMGAGAVLFLEARLRNGIDAIMDVLDFDSALEKSDVVITGEGKLDEQTLSGKVVAGVARRAQAEKKFAIGVAGQSTLAPEALSRLGLKALFSLAKEFGMEAALKDPTQALIRLSQGKISELLRQNV